MNMLMLYEGLDDQQRQYGGYIQRGQPPLNIIIKIINNKIYGMTKISMQLNKLYLKHIEIAKNDILKNEATGISMVNVRGENN